MKQFKIATGLFVLLIAFTATSCDDDEVTKTNTDLLTQHTWVIKSGTPADDALVMVAIEAGIEYSFKKDGTLITIDHRIDEPMTGKWEFNDDETKIISDKGTDHETTSDISKLDNANLEFISTSGERTITILFVKK